MTHLLPLATPLLALAACVHLGRQAGWRLGGGSGAERAVIGFIVAVAWVTVGGYLLGAFHLLAHSAAWLGWLALGVAIAGRPRPCCTARGPRARRWWRLARGRPLPGLALAGVGFVALTSVVIMLGSAPNNWDAMLYHLTRVGYYLQQGSFEAFGANFYSQEELGKNSAVLLAGLLQLSGGADWVTGIPQFTAWLVGGAVVHATARTFGWRHSACAFAGATWMLLGIAWLESTTAQNDVLIATHLAAAFFFLRRFATRGRRHRDLVLAGLAVGLALGTKAGAYTMLPALALAAGPRLWRPRVALVAGLAALPVVLPSGVVENYRRFGHPLGHVILSETVFRDRAPAFRLSAAGHNALRFGFDFCTLDQVPPADGLATALGRAKGGIVRWLAGHGLDLARTTDTRMNFWIDRAHRPDDNLSYFGPFGLLVAAGWVAACVHARLRWLAAAGVVYFALQCLAGPYDLIRGRQFLYGAALALPGLAWWVNSWRRRGRISATIFVAVALLHVAPAGIWRNNFFLLPAADRGTFWTQDRVWQMTGFHASHPAHRAFAAQVPPGVRLGVGLEGYEYPLFGPRLSRTLVPVKQRLQAGEQLPPELALDWLVFDAAVHAPQPGDIDLGANWWLRRMR